MAIERKDRVKDTTTTTGTGTVTLTGTAPSGYRSVSAAHTDGATVRYAISAGAEWEVGEGIYTASGTTLSRASVLASSNAGALVNFSAGTKDVITTLTAGEVDGLAQAIAALSSGKIVQVVEGTPYTTYSSTAMAIPNDDTIPQNTDGAEWITVTITPTSVTNRLVIEANMPYIAGNAAIYATCALFQDTTANALSSATQGCYAGDAPGNIYVRHEMAAGTTSATIFKLRAGAANAGTLYVNGLSSGRKYGGANAVRIRVTEVAV